MNGFGVLITAYENHKQVLDNIRHIRSFKELKDIQICVVSTTENPQIKEAFYNLVYAENVQPLTVIVWDTAPGNKSGIYLDKIEKLDYFQSWRHKYLPARILLSIEKGLISLNNSGCNVGLHLHSDTFLNSIQWIKERLDGLKNLVAYWDLCLEDNGIYAPEGVHIHPEGILINITNAISSNFIYFSEIYESEFTHYNYGSIESLIGCWANYCIDGNPIMGPENKLGSNFNKLFKPILKRDYHGNWFHYRNLEGVQ